MANEPGSQGGGPADDIQRQFNDAVGKLTGPGEPLIALGAILFVFVDIFGNIIFDDWGVDYLQLVPAWFVLAAIGLFRFKGSALPVNYTLLLATLGLIAGFVGVREIIGDLENSFFDYDTSSIIFGLITWAASIVMLLGAIQLWPSVKNG
ncbi:MAG: hypothetical protein O3A10_11840 [Chloroflexi bacterium]|nr:hypothetical protein [Chloroflexota bacterium]MDA1147065.1 hypothetical protein [Chloroflexota bacterium]